MSARRVACVPLLAAAAALCAGALAGDGARPAAAAAADRGAARGEARLAARPARARGGARVGVVASGLAVPWDIAFLPGGAALVTERAGRVRLVERGRLRPRPLARVPVSARGEGGLLGIAVDPAFRSGRRFVYLYATVGAEMQVQRWRLAGGRLRRHGLVLGGIRAGAVHDSGRLRIGPDGHLYVATGDAGTGRLAADPRSLNGKVLRLSPAEYRGRARDPQRYATGLRNPQGLAWRGPDDRLYVTDHGPSGFDGPGGDDELNLVRSGGDYGWPRARGRDQRPFASPAWLWPASVAPSGLTAVRRGGSRWTGDLLVATLRGRSLRRLVVRGGRIVADRPLLRGRYGRLRAVVEAPDGSIWVTTSNRDGRGSPAPADDRILRVVPPRG